MGAFVDLTGQRFGRLLVLERGTNDSCGKPRWHCRCDCGQETHVNSSSLRAGRSASCGCRAGLAAASQVQNLIGERFGRLTVISRAGSSNYHAAWLCHCDCGKSKRVLATKLRAGQISCGCAIGNSTHGHTSKGTSPTYASWKAMIARCTYPSNPAFAYYARNGITIYEHWRKFENFLADMGERPGLEFSIDRYPNKMGNYEPDNCRWATKREQANNRVTNKMFTYEGREMTFAELVRVTGCDKERLRHRLLRAGWSVEEAVNRPHSQGQRVV